MSGSSRRLAYGIVIGALSLAAGATKMDAAAPDAAFDLRLKKLETELRCLVCQNQTLADSTPTGRRPAPRCAAPPSWKSDDGSRRTSSRYGDLSFTTRRSSTTWLLWGGPFALLGGGGLLWWVVLRRRARSQMPAPRDPYADALARAILENAELPATG